MHCAAYPWALRYKALIARALDRRAYVDAAAADEVADGACYQQTGL